MNFVAAFLYALSSSVLTATILSFFFGGLNPLIAGTSLSLGAAVAAGTLWRDRRLMQVSGRPGSWEWVAIALFTLFALRSFLWLIFQDGDAIKVLSPNNLGDLSLHITYIRYLANGVAFWPDNPILAGGKLGYPVGLDLFNALLLLVGVDLFRGLIWIGLIGSAALGAALWKWGRGVALVAFLCNGGFFGFEIVWTRSLVDFQSEQAWKSIPLALFVTQRGLLFALPAGLLLLASWRAHLFRASEEAWRLPRWGELLLYASLPIFHLHTFLFLSLLLAVWFILQPPARRDIALLVGSAFLPASALVLLVTGMLKGASVLGWHPGWMANDPAFLEWVHARFDTLAPALYGPLFWMMNFGVLPLLVLLVALSLLRKDASRWARATVFPAILVFVLCCFVKFAPWEWDNTKLMIWSYLLVVPILWQETFATRPIASRTLATIVLFGSGFISLLGGLDASHRGEQIASRSELDGVARAIRAIPVEDRFAGCPDYNHPLLLCGRSMALGYTGHAWSHGLRWQPVDEKITSLMNGEEGWQTRAAELGTRYLFWGEKERAQYSESAQPWKGSTVLIGRGEWGELYDLQQPLAVSAAE